MLVVLILLFGLIATVSRSTRLPKYSARESRLFAADYLDLGKPYVANPENPPFFPLSIEDLATDASISIKVALVSQISRIRVDVRLRCTNRHKSMMRWLVLLGFLSDLFLVRLTTSR